MLIVLAALLLTGCQELQVRERAVKLARTAPGLYEQQVLDNLALLSAQPDGLPYFLLPNGGTAQLARTFQVQYTPGWDFITSGVYIARYLFDKQTAQVQGSNQCQESWQTFPISDPDKLILMHPH